MRLLGLDFETYWDKDYNLDKLGTAEYILDPRFEILGVSVRHEGEKLWMPDHAFQRWVHAVDWSDTATVMHHAHFDGGILAWKYGIVPAFYFDTLSMGRALYQKGELKELLEHCGLPAKREMPDTKGKHFIDLTPEEFATLGVYAEGDVDGTMNLLSHMLAKFPFTELQLINLTVRMFTVPTFRLDTNVVREVMDYENNKRETLLAQCRADLSDLRSGEKFATILRAQGIEPDTKQGKRGDTYAFAKQDSFMQMLLAHEDENIRGLAEARVAAMSNQALTRSARLLSLADKIEALPIYLKYGDTQTNRWAGWDGINWQNHQRPSKINPMKGRIRYALTAPPKHKVVGADSKTIEARTAAWWSGQFDLLQDFKTGVDVYSKIAGKIYHREILRNERPEDENPGFVGKVITLGSGYGMGWFKCATDFLRGPMGAEPVRFTLEDAEIMRIDTSYFCQDAEKVNQARELPALLSVEEKIAHCLVCDYLIALWRRENPMIVQSWKLCEKALRWMAEGEETSFGYLGRLRTIKDGLVLPNGMVMRYNDLRISEKKEWRYTNANGERVKIYGAKFFENIIQALDRIVVGEQMVEIAKDYHIALTSHDEVVTIVRQEEAEEALTRMVAAMRVAPEWCEGLPVDAKGHIGNSYGDVK